MQHNDNGMLSEMCDFKRQNYLLLATSFPIDKLDKRQARLNKGGRNKNYEDLCEVNSV